MSFRIISAVAAAMLTGAAIAAQASLSGRVSTLIGSVRTGLLVNAAGGLIALVMVLGVTLAGALELREYGTGRILSWSAAAGFLGIIIIMGIAFSVQGVGVTAGLAAVIMAQLVFGLAADAMGAAGGAALALDLRRIMGVAAMGVGVWLLVPR